MYYVEYIQTDGYCWFDTNILPTINTSAELSFSPGPKAGDWPVYFGKSRSDWDNTSFVFKSNNQGTQFDARFGNVDRSGFMSFTIWDDYIVNFNNTGITVNGNVEATWSPSIDSETAHTLWIAAENNTNTGGDWNRHRASIAKFYYLKLWDNGVLIGDFRPAIDDNNRIGFYDEVSQTFKANLGTGTPVAGPELSSIIATASKAILKATGETINIVVSCENAWTLTTSGETFLTISSTGDTSGATITATAPSYSGSTPREEHIIFTDTSTNDTADLTIKQKKYTNGQPFYLGSDEVMECFLGDSAVTEAYLGEDLVYSAGSPAPTPTGGPVNITITGATSCIDDGLDCKPYSSVTFSIKTFDMGEEGEVYAYAKLENVAYMPDNSEVMWELVDSGITSGVTSIAYDDTADTLTFIGEFDTGNTYIVTNETTELNGMYIEYGRAIDGEYNDNFDFATSVTLTPNYTDERNPLRTLTFTGVTFPSDEGETLAISDNDKFGFEMSWDGSDYTTNNWLAENWFSITYDDAEGEVVITADWGDDEYTIESKFERMGECVDAAQEYLQWPSGEYEATMPFNGGTPCAEE